MPIQTVAARDLQQRLKFIRQNATGETTHVYEWFVAQCSHWSGMHIVGTPGELRALRRALVKDAVELKARRATEVRVLVRAVARDPHRDPHRVASISGCTAGLNLSLRMPRKR